MIRASVHKLIYLLVVIVLLPSHLYAQDSALRFAFQNRIGSVLPIIALKKGFFAAQGLHVETQMFSSGPACAEALTSGAADIATMGDTTAIIALSRDMPVQLVASHASGEHRHRLMVMSSDIHTLSDLRGKRIGVKKGTSTYGGLQKMLACEGIKRGEVQLINLRPAILVEALMAGSIDAFAASEPTPSLGEMNGARQLATLGGLGNNYPILIVARDSFVAKHPQQLEAFIRAMEQALMFLRQHSGEAHQIVASTLNLPQDVIASAMQRHHYHLTLDESIRASLKQTAHFLIQQQIITTEPDF